MSAQFGCVACVGVNVAPMPRRNRPFRRKPESSRPVSDELKSTLFARSSARGTEQAGDEETAGDGLLVRLGREQVAVLQRADAAEFRLRPQADARLDGVGDPLIDVVRAGRGGRRGELGVHRLHRGGVVVLQLLDLGVLAFDERAHLVEAALHVFLRPHPDREHGRQKCDERAPWQA
jgi:hypothetical protein